MNEYMKKIEQEMLETEKELNEAMKLVDVQTEKVRTRMCKYMKLVKEFHDEAEVLSLDVE